MPPEPSNAPRPLIFPDDWDRFKIAEKSGQLYWDGNQVKTEVTLTRVQWAIAAFTTVVLLFSQITSGVKDFLDLKKGEATPQSNIVFWPSNVNLPSRPFEVIQIGCVGPFDSGLSENPSTNIPCVGVHDLQKNLDSHQDEPALLLFLGSSDKFDIRGFPHQRFGSNQGLAQARADWLVRQLSFHGVPLSSDSKITTLNLVNGPSLTGVTIKGPQQTSGDRTVRVVGLWPLGSAGSTSTP